MSDEVKNGSRFREIMAVLLRHRVTRGIDPEKLRSIIEDLGPTFIKLGQILSMRSDMLPKEYCDALAGLRTDAAPMSIDAVRDIISHEYGKPPEEIFSYISDIPIGSASIAQVHKARLKDGSTVVVKVQRPDVFETMERDINLLRKAGRLFGKTAFKGVINLDTVLDEMWLAAQEEMDFSKEAANLLNFKKLNSNIAYSSCPDVNFALTGKNILVMEYIDGIRISDREALIDAGYELADIGDKLAENFVKQVLDDRFFHADPHPGNIFIRDGKIVWIDLGMMGRLSERDASLFRSAVAAVASHDVEALADIVLTMGIYNEKIDRFMLLDNIDMFLTKYGAAALNEINLGDMITELMDIASLHKITLPRGMTMFCRSLVSVEGVISQLSPQTSIVAIISNHISSSLLDEFDFHDEAIHMLAQLRASGHKATMLPSQISDALAKLSRGQTKIAFESHLADKTSRMIERSTGKITLALISSALIIGGCMTVSAQIEPKLAGIPWLSVVMFMLAALAAGAAIFRRKR